MDILAPIPEIYMAGFTSREADYCKTEAELYYSLKYDTPDSRKACTAVVNKREEFLNMWLDEYNKQHSFHFQKLSEHITSADSRATSDALFNSTDEELNNAYTGKI